MVSVLKNKFIECISFSGFVIVSMFFLITFVEVLIQQSADLITESVNFFRNYVKFCSEFTM